MTLQVSPTLAKSFPIHQDWIKEWCPQLRPSKLRDTLLNDDRYAKRIADMVVEHHFRNLNPPEKSLYYAPRLERAITAVFEDDLVQIGHFWMAPRLSSQLLDPRKRALFGIKSRTHFEAIFSFRNHTTVGSLPVIDVDYDFEHEGRACLLAWIESLPKSIGARLTLVLPQMKSIKPDLSLERVSLFRTFLKTRNIR